MRRSIDNNPFSGVGEAVGMALQRRSRKKAAEAKKKAANAKERAAAKKAPAPKKPTKTQLDVRAAKRRKRMYAKSPAAGKAHDKHMAKVRKPAAKRPIARKPAPKKPVAPKNQKAVGREITRKATASLPSASRSGPASGALLPPKKKKKAPAKKAPAKKAPAKKAPAKKAPAKKAPAKKRPPGYRPPGWRPHPN